MKNCFALITAVGLVASSPAVLAQSIITLESFDLGGDDPATAEAVPTLPNDQRQSCLVDPTQSACGSGAGSSSRSFSLSDVVNLGIIDRSEVEVENEQGTVVRVEEQVEPLPSIDLEILFDYDSASLRPDQRGPLIALARDLRSIDFNRAQLVLMGHTDGVGSADYNRALSYRRAASVAAFLSDAADIPLHRIRSSGMGFDYLRFPHDPSHPGNRRVQILLVE